MHFIKIIKDKKGEACKSGEVIWNFYKLWLNFRSERKSNCIDFLYKKIATRLDHVPSEKSGKKPWIMVNRWKRSRYCHQRFSPPDIKKNQLKRKRKITPFETHNGIYYGNLGSIDRTTERRGRDLGIGHHIKTNCPPYKNHLDCIFLELTGTLHERKGKPESIVKRNQRHTKKKSNYVSRLLCDIHLYNSLVTLRAMVIV